jgi:hypothetical protein
MKKVIFIVLLAMLFTSVNVKAQEEKYDAQTIVEVLTYNRMAETNCMVNLNPKQKKVYESSCIAYYKKMYQATYKTKNAAIAAQLIYDAKKVLADTLMNILSEKQRVTYIRNTGAEEVKHKTIEKVASLRKSGEYSEEELEQAYSEIYEYLMLEKIAYIQNKYDIATQKENIAQLKNREPRALKDANNQQKNQRKGKAHQHGYKW